MKPTGGELLLTLISCTIAPTIVEIIVYLRRERKINGFLTKIRKRTPAFLLASFLTIAIYITVVILHEILHALIMYAIGMPVLIHIRLGGFSLIEAYVGSRIFPPYPFNFLVPIAGTFSSVILFLLITTVFRTKRDASLWFFLFMISDVAINIFTTLGDGAYLPTPKIPWDLAVIVGVLRIISISGFVNSLIFNNEPVNLEWI